MTITTNNCLEKDIHAIVELQNAGDAFTKSLNDTIVVSPGCRSFVLNFGKGEANRGVYKIETHVTNWSSWPVINLYCHGGCLQLHC